MTSAGRDRWLAINFAATIFVSAFLLFQVQPLVSKYILPWFGGSPAVWTTCMLFFQSLLFAGYAYAHFSVKWLKPKQQAVLHLALIVAAIAAIVFLRVVPDDDWKPEDSSNPAGRILGMLMATVGLPYFVLSSTGPLVQAWFARSFPGKIPYRLYALSNFGSLLALLSYPFVFERIYDAPQQATFWSGGFLLYGIFCGLAAACIWVLFRNQEAGVRVQESAGELQTSTESSHEKSPWWHVALWIILPAFASVAFLATTNHVTTDVTPMPFLWVLPLSVYLLTLIIAFDRPAWYRPGLWAAFTLLAIYAASVIYHTGLSVEVHDCGTLGAIFKFFHQAFAGEQGVAGKSAVVSPDINVGFIAYVVINLAAMFGICMLCHGELVRIRPHPRHLTAYFLMSAAGGAIGGLAVSIVCPVVFTTYFEFKLTLFIGFLLAIGLLARSMVGRKTEPKQARGDGMLELRIVVLALLLLPVAGIGLYDLWNFFDDGSSNARFRTRNFFGTLAVIEDGTEGDSDRRYRLMHGGITHGFQYLDAERRSLPTTYYTPSSGIGRAMGHYGKEGNTSNGMRVGVVGLGTGTLATYLKENDFVRFYEINQAVIDIAEPGEWFTYLKDCKGKYDIQLGDARLTLERETDSDRYHVLALDAFSGDAIPVHLLTEEAFEIYLKRLATPENGGVHGTIAIHITNHYVNLEPVLRALAEKFDLKQIQIELTKSENSGFRTKWILLTKNDKLEEELKDVAKKPDANRPPPVLWTDARSNLFEVLE
jgi:hypothetical protein